MNTIETIETSTRRNKHIHIVGLETFLSGNFIEEMNKTKRGQLVYTTNQTDITVTEKSRPCIYKFHVQPEDAYLIVFAFREKYLLKYKASNPSTFEARLQRRVREIIKNNQEL